MINHAPPPSCKPRAYAHQVGWLCALAILTGSGAALFLWSLELATSARFDFPWLLYFLPFFGLLMGWFYQHFSGPTEGGNHIVLEAVRGGDRAAPRRMAPMILLATVLTHLGGGSAGREGTAIQIGGGIAGSLAKTLGIHGENRRILHMAGLAAGFGAVFGTPWAGALFALEVPVAGRIQWRGSLHCLAAAWAGDWVCRAWGIHHISWPILPSGIGPWDGNLLFPDYGMLAKLVFCGILFGVIARFFSQALKISGRQVAKWIPAVPWRPFWGGMAIIAMVHLMGSRAYLGLGVWSPFPTDPTIIGFFDGTAFHPTAWLWKGIFTLVTLATGFKGGEVTPLFFIGAALGHSLSVPLGLPVNLLAALGMVAVFAGAAKTPWTCMVMGAELFGMTHAALFLMVGLLASRFAGSTGIYLSENRT